jgi:hypothetical protein
MTHCNFRRHLATGLMVAFCSFAAVGATYGAPAVSEQADFVDGIIVKYRDAAGGTNKARNVGAELAARFNVGLSYKRQMARGAHVMASSDPLSGFQVSS